MTLNDIASTVTSKLPPGWEYWAVWSSAIIATIISLCHIISHLQIYSKPSQQRLIVRISCVIPIYGLTAALSFQFPAAILYFAAVRDIAEAFVIYSFLNLLYDYLGGEGAILNAINGVPIQGSWWSCTCCLSGAPFTIATLRFCKKATLQFCGVRPITSILEVILYECGFYTLEKSFSLHSAPLFITIIYNISITLALYGLALFYMSTKKLLAPQNPLLKFISVKGIILFAYWQTLLLSILAQFDYLEHPGAEQALLTALESVPSAILVAAAFPVKPYIQGYSPTGGSNDRLKQISVSMKDTVNPKDIIQDVVHNFSSRYRGYAQYHNIQNMSKPLNHAILQAEVHQLIEKYNTVQSVVLEQIKDDRAILIQNYSTGPEETVSTELEKVSEVIQKCKVEWNQFILHINNDMRRLANRINACSDLLGREIVKAPSQIRDDDSELIGTEDSIKANSLEALAFSNEFERVKTDNDVTKKKRVLSSGSRLWFKTAPLHYTTKSICKCAFTRCEKCGFLSKDSNIEIMPHECNLFRDVRIICPICKLMTIPRDNMMRP